MTTPRAYIACLASYNAGILHGGWIDLDGAEEIAEAIESILSNSPETDAEEWAIHDHEYCGNLSEYAGLTCLQNIIDAHQQCEQDGIDWEQFIEFCDHLGEDLEVSNIRKFQDAYAGSARSLVAWCEEFLDETGQLSEVPENLRFYFNYEAFARDMEINDVFTLDHGGDVLVFWHH
ncbi:antirestriction protein ArdA [Cerasicoccus frondis]|uniref:antirestriction protein ArdA n=1 Tax=Cerasicoccus frondis TaxID=490090 RepID=UPI0028526F86|nr:antirestriction protein ArdA [Cerasicoccus frondis]